MISLLRQKYLRLRDRGAIAVGFLGDRYELGEIALGFFPFTQTVDRLRCTVTTHCRFLNDSLPVPDEPDIALRGSLAGRNTDRLQIVLHGVLADLAAHGCADLARAAVMHAIVDPRVDDLGNIV